MTAPIDAVSGLVEERDDDACPIDLGQGRVAWVDRRDLARVEAMKWYAKPNHRVTYARSRDLLLMHRFILEAEPGTIVDHIDRDGLNNRRANLRICSHRQNMWNRVTRNKHGFKGLSFKPNAKFKPWRAVIKINDQKQHLGYFATKEEAAAAYDAAASRTYGEFANLNFPALSNGEPHDR